MRNFRLCAALAALVLPLAGAFAETATPEGAKSIEQDYAAYFTQAAIDKGIVTVAPDNDGYVVTWDLQKVADLGGLEGAIKIEPLTYRLVPGPAGAWTLRGDHFPHVSFDISTPKGQTTGALDFHGAGLDGVYDPQAEEFLRSKLGIDAIDGAFKMIEAGRQSDVKIAEEGIVLETRAKPNADDEGVDLAIAEAFKTLRETASAPADQTQSEAAQMNYGISGTVAGATFTGLRAHEISELWKSVIAHIDADEPPPEIRTRLIAALPFWNQLRAHAEISDVGFETPQGGAQIKMLQESLDLTGFTRKGAAEIGLAIEGMTLKSDLLPPWSGGLWPAALSLDLVATGEDWYKAARIAIDDPDFLNDGELSPDAQDKIGAVLTAGNPKLVLKPGHLKIPTLDLAFEGEAHIESNQPAGHLRISADSLDKIIALLQEQAKTEPDLTPAVLGVTFLKGLATTDADGRLVWEIAATADGEVTVNGALLPKGR
jgi:hypothetical protein